MAARTGIAQGDVSRIEQRVSLDGSELATLRRYVEALGAELELAVVFPKTGHRFVLAGASTKPNDDVRPTGPTRSGRSGNRPARRRRKE